MWVCCWLYNISQTDLTSSTFLNGMSGDFHITHNKTSLSFKNCLPVGSSIDIRVEVVNIVYYFLTL